MSDLECLPAEGAHLTRHELETVMRSVRSIIDGTEADEPNRSHAVTIAYVTGEAIDRTGGSSP